MEFADFNTAEAGYEARQNVLGAEWDYMVELAAADWELNAEEFGLPEVAWKDVSEDDKIAYVNGYWDR